MQLNHVNFHILLDMTLESSIGYLVKIIICWNISIELSMPLINKTQRLAVLSEVLNQLLFVRSMKTIKNLTPNKLWSFMTWWQNNICYQAGQAGHMHRNFISHHEIDRTWQWRLGQVGTFNEIYQSHKEPTTYPEFQQNQHTNIVEWWIICSASKHKREHWWCSINGKIIYHC